MKPPRFLTTWLIICILLLILSLFVPLSWPSYLIVSAQAAVLIAIIWLFFWVVRASRASVQLVVLLVTALTAASWMLNTYYLLVSNPSDSALGPSPMSLLATIIELITIGFITYLTVRLHLTTDSSLSEL